MFQNEPALTYASANAAFIGLLTEGVSVYEQFVHPLTQAQNEALIGFGGALFVASTFLAGYLTRRGSTPNSKLP